jgi:hypothetical protein
MKLSKHAAERFWSKVAVANEDECWLWRGWGNVEGYGRFDVDGKKPLATHIALMLAGRPRPAAPNDKALHGDCSNPRCCNPAHLRWGSGLENADDRERLQRRSPARGEANGLNRLTEDQVLAIRASPLSQRAAARQFGVSQTWVSKIRRGLVWTHL